MSKTVQLTNRDKSAVWKSKDKETNEPKFVEMADMDDYHLQAALVLCQKSKVQAYLHFINHSKREAQLKREAKNRNMEIKDIDYIKPTWLGNKFCEFKEAMSAAYSSILRKDKKHKEEKV